MTEEAPLGNASERLSEMAMAENSAYSNVVVGG